MRIAIIIPAIIHRGPVLVIRSLTDILSEDEQFKIKVFYLDKKVDPGIRMKVPVERLNLFKFSFEDFDIVHTNGLRPDLLAYINRRKIRYHISTIHNFVFDDLEYRYNRIISLIFGHVWLWLWKSADKLVCVSYSMRDYYSKWYSFSKLAVIHNGIPEIFFSITLKNDIHLKIVSFHEKGLIVAACVCVLTRTKGIDSLLNYIAENKKISLVIIGDGKEFRNLSSLAKKIEISDRCYFAGFRNDAVQYFNHFDLLFIPSRSEGFCITLVEAVQQKVPVICSDISVFREMFRSSEVTFFNLHDKSSIDLAFRSFLDIGKEKINSAFSTYRTKFTSRLMAERYIEIYQSA